MPSTRRSMRVRGGLAGPLLACLLLPACSSPSPRVPTPSPAEAPAPAVPTAAALPPAPSSSVAVLDSSASRPLPGSAWWVWSRFGPTGRTFEGVPVAEIDPTWVLASPLGPGALPPEAEGHPSLLAEATVGFVRQGDYDGDGTPDRASVGVYEARDGSRGAFLLVSSVRGGAWRPVFHARLLDDPAFVVLQDDGGGLTVWYCMECDVFSRLTAEDGRYRLW